MDTHWFAVDEHGHVAVFQSKELGPVPESASAVWPTDGRLEQVFLPQLADVDPDALSYEAAVRVHALPTSLRMRVAATRFVGVDFRVSETVCVSRLTFC